MHGGCRPDAREGTIRENENGSEGTDMHLDLSHNTLPVLMNTASVGQPRCVEGANLGRRLSILTTFMNASAYHCTVLAREFVKADRVGQALAVGTTLVGVVEGVEVVVIDVVAVNDIGDEFQE